ncbi:diaminopimelate decarboxylase, partial [bacterium]|nr:diaminopimelate decarboxylase [bacterium]
LYLHIGSQIFETQCYYDEVEILVKEISRIKEKFGLVLDEMNIGGGLGVKYTDSDNPPEVEALASVVTDAMHKYAVEIPTIYIEPGRSIISTSGVTLYTVGSSKQVSNGRKYVAVDGGMADNPRPSMYQAEYTAQVANKPTSENLEKVTIAGRFCESGDILINEIELPKLESGDILCVYNTGAYNYSMASNYNRVEKPAMVLVNNSHSDIIVYRETLDDLISKDNIPDRLR